MGVLAPFLAFSAAMRWPTAAGFSGPTGTSRSVWQESTSRPNTRNANGVPAGMVEEVSLVSVCLAMSMRRAAPNFCSMLPEASRMSSTAPLGLVPGASVTATLPGSCLPGTTLSAARAMRVVRLGGRIAQLIVAGLERREQVHRIGLRPWCTRTSALYSPSRAPFGTTVMKLRGLSGPFHDTLKRFAGDRLRRARDRAGHGPTVNLARASVNCPAR